MWDYCDTNYAVYVDGDSTNGWTVVDLSTGKMVFKTNVDVRISNKEDFIGEDW